MSRRSLAIVVYLACGWYTVCEDVRPHQDDQYQAFALGKTQILGTWGLCLMVMFYGVLVVGESHLAVESTGDGNRPCVHAFGLGLWDFMLQPESQRSRSLEAAFCLALVREFSAYPVPDFSFCTEATLAVSTWPNIRFHKTICTRCQKYQVVSSN